MLIIPDVNESVMANINNKPLSIFLLPFQFKYEDTSVSS